MLHGVTDTQIDHKEVHVSADIAVAVDYVFVGDGDGDDGVGVGVGDEDIEKKQIHWWDDDVHDAVAVDDDFVIGRAMKLRVG